MVYASKIIQATPRAQARWAGIHPFYWVFCFSFSAIWTVQVSFYTHIHGNTCFDSIDSHTHPPTPTHNRHRGRGFSAAPPAPTTPFLPLDTPMLARSGSRYASTFFVSSTRCRAPRGLGSNEA